MSWVKVDATAFLFSLDHFFCGHKGNSPIYFPLLISQGFATPSGTQGHRSEPHSRGPRPPPLPDGTIRDTRGAFALIYTMVSFMCLGRRGGGGVLGGGERGEAGPCVTTRRRWQRDYLRLSALDWSQRLVNRGTSC